MKERSENVSKKWLLILIIVRFNHKGNVMTLIRKVVVSRNPKKETIIIPLSVCKNSVQNGYNCCGTVQTHTKDFTSALVITKNMNVSRGYIDYRSNGPLFAV